jgi:hypothetical protein
VTDPGTRAEATEYLDGGLAILRALDAAAASGRTGTAWLMGGNVGALHFRNGLVVGAELEGAARVGTMLINSGRVTGQAWDDFVRAWPRGSVGPGPPIPEATDLGALEWVAKCREAIVEAAFELIPPDRPEVLVDMVFQPDEIPGWTASGRPVPLAVVRTEMDRWQAVLDALRPVVTPDSEVFRVASELSGRIQVSAQQWRLLGAVTDGSTARSLARALGAGTFATTLLVAQLGQLGMLSLGARSVVRQPPGSAFPRALFCTAQSVVGAGRG